jgi:hypothetical protein
VKLKQELRLRASGGEPLPTSEHCSFPPPPKARILLCRGPVLWVLELPQDRLGFAVKTSGVCADVDIAFCAWLRGHR